MLHENIKELARRSLIADKVMFGESRKAHPLGFDGFMVDATVDRALLQLNSSVYDSATSLQIECGNIVSMLKESLNVNVSTGVARLYKESKVGEVFKKVIAYIVKAVKYLFVELPKKIYNILKSFFTKKKGSAGMAKKTEENIKKTEESLKTVHEEIKSKINSPEFESWRNEMAGELDGVKTRMEAMSNADAESATDDVINMAKKVRAEKDANMTVVSGEYDDESKARLKKIDELQAIIKKIMDAKFSDKYDSAKYAYRDAELKMMADTLLSSIESGKTDISILRKHNFFKTHIGRSMSALSEDFNVVAMGMLIRACSGVPYIRNVAAKYFAKNKGIEIYGGEPSSVSEKPSAVIQYLRSRIESLDKVATAFPKLKGSFDIDVFSFGFVGAMVKCVQNNDGEPEANVDALKALDTSNAIINDVPFDGGDLNKIIAQIDRLISAVDSFTLVSRNLGNVTPDVVATKLGVDVNSDAVTTEFANIMTTVSLLVSAVKNVSVMACKCVMSITKAEDAIIKMMVSADDAIIAITTGQLARYMAEDASMANRAWKILLAK